MCWGVFECIRSFIITVTICNWLASYSSDNLAEMIFTAVFFIIDVSIYGLILLGSECVSFWQISKLEDRSYPKYLLIGILNTTILFLVISLLTQGALVEALGEYFTNFL